jgi:hypothetical protein
MYFENFVFSCLSTEMGRVHKVFEIVIKYVKMLLLMLMCGRNQLLLLLRKQLKASKEKREREREREHGCLLNRDLKLVARQRF